MSPESPDLVGAALEYAAQGWFVFPLHSPTADGCSCKRNCGRDRGKHPRTPNGAKDASRDGKTIRQWWKKWPEANIAIATGRKSGIVVLDIDGESGEQSLIRAALEGNHLPDSYSVRTGRGAHVYFTAETEVRNSAGMLADGLDIRGEGGYVVAAPSLHTNGTRYEINESAILPAPCPEWLLTLIRSPERAQTRQSGAAASTIRAAAIGPEDQTTERGVPALTEGRRNDALFRLACALRRRGADQEQIEAELIEHNRRRCVPALDDAELLKIAESASRYEPGGGDILQAAAEAIEGKTYRNHAEAFRGFCIVLQRLRGPWSVALPVERIGQILHCHWTLVARYRRQAVAEGWLEPDEPCIETRRAATFRVLLSEAKEPLVRQGVSLEIAEYATTAGVVTVASETRRNSPSETSSFPPSETGELSFAGLRLDSEIFSTRRQ